jgi:hypothetical protein
LLAGAYLLPLFVDLALALELVAVGAAAVNCADFFCVVGIESHSFGFEFSQE